MSYATVKTMLAGRLGALGYAESETVDDFTNASANEYGNTFILKCVSGEMVEPDSQTLADRFYDSQTWQVQVVLARSENNDVINRDELHARKDAILADLDDPESWRASVRFMKYKSWTMQELENYFVLTVNLNVVDVYTY